MITIATSDLREFIRNGRFIKPANNIAILGYVRLQCEGGIATLTKTNLGASITQSFPATHTESSEVLLLDERIISKLCEETNSSDIKIDASGSSIAVTDGRARLSFTKDNLGIFPNIPTWEEDQTAFTFGSDVLESIGIAVKYASRAAGNIVTNLSFVHLAKRNAGTDVMAMPSDRSSAYIRHFKEDLPPMLLSEEACIALSKLKAAQYQRNGTSDMFKSVDVVYGFTQQEYTTPAYQPFINNLIREGGVILAKDDLIRFCELSKIVTVSHEAHAFMRQGEAGSLQLSFQDVDMGTSNSEEIQTEQITAIEPFCFNVKLMQPALSALPYNRLQFCRVNEGNFAIYTPEDEQYMGVICGIVK